MARGTDDAPDFGDGRERQPLAMTTVKAPRLRRFVADCEFIVGETGQPFLQAVWARDMESAYKKVRRWFHLYYGSGRYAPSEDSANYSLWEHVSVAVKLRGMREVKTLDDLWAELIPIGDRPIRTEAW